jgi:flagellar basal-body rod protein FlgB
MNERLFGIHGAALTLRSERMGVIASNIANAATPGYKARDLDFRSALDSAARGAGGGDSLRYRVPVQVSLDGNTVELATEQTAFTENALDYRATLSFLSGRIETMMAALKGGE